MPSAPATSSASIVKLYERNDVLAQVLEQAREDLGGQGLPVPERGSLDIEQVLRAEFGFVWARHD